MALKGSMLTLAPCKNGHQHTLEIGVLTISAVLVADVDVAASIIFFAQ